MASPYPPGSPPAAPAATERVNNTGNIIAVVGGLLAAIAFVALPYLNAPGSSVYLTGMTFVSNFSQYLGQSTQGNLVIMDLWLQLALAVIVLLLAGIGWIRSQNSHQRASKGMAGITLVAAILCVAAALGFIGLFTAGTTGATLSLILPFLGVGFWLIVVGGVVAAVGALVQMASS